MKRVLKKNREDDLHSVIILDDVGSEIKLSAAVLKKLTAMQQNRRHDFTSYFCLLLKFKDAPTGIRNNISHLMLFKPKNEIEKETIASELFPFNKKKFQQMFNYIFENKNRFSMMFVDKSLKIQISLHFIMGLIFSNYTMRKRRPLIKYYQFYIYMPPKKKMKQKQKQKQSQNVRQAVAVKIEHPPKTQRRPVRRTGTRTAPLVNYQQALIPLAPAIDYGKIKHEIASINNTIFHNLN